MAVFSVTYVLNSDKKQLTGQQFIEKVAFIAQRSYDWVCHRPWKSYDWVFRTPRALPVRATRTARAQIVNVAPNNRTEIPTQSIEGRPLLMLDLMNAPEKYHEFSDLEFVKVSTDPFIYRFHRLEKAEMQKLQRYIDLTNQYPEHFAHVEKATLVTETKGKGEVTCPGIISARNDNIFPLFLRCDHRMKVGEDLKKYIYTQVREITELLTKIDYIIDFENLQQRLQFWRGSERMQLKLAFLNTQDYLPSIQNTSDAKKMNELCLKRFGRLLENFDEELTQKSGMKATVNLRYFYALFIRNTVPISNNL